jgi:uncharacterized protein YjbI with pentapeptide repeats
LPLPSPLKPRLLSSKAPALPGVDRPTRALERKQATRAEYYESVRDSSEKNRNFSIAWLLFASYVMVIVFSTSDLQLIRTDSTITLPIIGAQLPLLSFYLSIPVLVIAVHFNLLQNLDTHGYKLKEWVDSWDGSPPREQLSAFLFDYAVLEQGGAFDIIVRIANDILTYWLGPIVLGLILLRFSDYQDPLFTGWHLIAFAFSLWLAFRARNRKPSFKPAPHFIWRAVAGLTFTVLAAHVTLTALLVEELWRDNDLAHQWMEMWTSPTKTAFLAEQFIPRLVSPPNAEVTLLDARLELRAKLDGKETSDWWTSSGQGARLAGRQLQYSYLAGADLRRADFSEAKLRRAILRGAHLQGANFGSADLRDARLETVLPLVTDASDSIFDNADLSGTVLTGVNLIGASLKGTKLYGVDLGGANLHGANLENAHLEGSRLFGARFYGANLAGAYLHGAEITLGRFDGSNMRRVQMLGIVLNGIFPFLTALGDGANLTDIRVSNIGTNLGRPIAISLDIKPATVDWAELKDLMRNKEAQDRIERAKAVANRYMTPALIAELQKKVATANPNRTDHPEIVSSLAKTWCGVSLRSKAQGVGVLRRVMEDVNASWPFLGSGIVSPAPTYRELAIQMLSLPECENVHARICAIAKTRGTTLPRCGVPADAL